MLGGVLLNIVDKTSVRGEMTLGEVVCTPGGSLYDGCTIDGVAPQDLRDHGLLVFLKKNKICLIFSKL